MVSAFQAEFSDLNLTCSVGGQISFDVFPSGYAAPRHPIHIPHPCKVCFSPRVTGFFYSNVFGCVVCHFGLTTADAGGTRHIVFNLLKIGVSMRFIFLVTRQVTFTGLSSNSGGPRMLMIFDSLARDVTYMACLCMLSEQGLVEMTTRFSRTLGQKVTLFAAQRTQSKSATGSSWVASLRPMIPTSIIFGHQTCR